MKQRTKNVIGSLGFLVGLFVLLILVSRVFEPKNNTEKMGMDNESATGFLGEPQNSIDVVMLGDSELVNSVIPLQIFRDYGFSTYNCANKGGRLSYSEYLLKKVYECQKPKYVILETNEFYSEISFARLYVLRLEGLFPLFQYHDRWRSLTAEDFTMKKAYTYTDPNRGYGFDLRVMAGEIPEDYMAPYEWMADIPAGNEELIRSIYNLCRKNGSELILLSTPSTVNWSYPRHNRVVNIAEKLGISYIDMNLLQDEVPIDWKTETRDAGDHVNYYGAVKVTSYLGKWLKENCSLTDHRGEELFIPWEKATDKFYKKIKKKIKE